MIGFFLIQEKSVRTLVLEYLRGDTVGGEWLGHAPYQSVREIANGAGVDARAARRVLAESCFERARLGGRRVAYRLRPPPTKSELQTTIARVLGETHEPMARLVLGKKVSRAHPTATKDEILSALDEMVPTYVRRTPGGRYETQR